MLDFKANICSVGEVPERTIEVSPLAKQWSHVCGYEDSRAVRG